MADNPAIPTVEVVLGRVRRDLDEALDTATNQWDDTDLLDWLNRGARHVWQLVRKQHQNRFLRTILSTDDPLPIYGVTFAPAGFVFQSGTAALKLPADCLQVVSLEPVFAADADVDLGTIFYFQPLHTERSRAARREVGGTDGAAHYYEVEFRTDGPYLTFSPAGNVTTAVNLRLTYVHDAAELQSDGTFAGTGFNRHDIDAIVAYTVRAAMAQPQAAAAEDRALANGVLQETAHRAQDVAAPRHTDHLVVEGFIEDELDYD